MRKRYVAPILACVTLAIPAGASAHATSPTVALDYRLVLDRPPAISRVSSWDSRRRPCAPPLCREGSSCSAISRADASDRPRRHVRQPRLDHRGRPAATQAGHGWNRVGGATFAWHDHRLAPPPYDGGRLGAVARFAFPRPRRAARDAWRDIRSLPPAPVGRGSPARRSLALAVAALLQPRRRRAQLATALGGLAGWPHSSLLRRGGRAERACCLGADRARRSLRRRRGRVIRLRGERRRCSRGFSVPRPRREPRLARRLPARGRDLAAAGVPPARVGRRGHRGCGGCGTGSSCDEAG